MTILATALLTLPAAALPPTAPPGEPVSLTHRAQRKWKLRLPAESWRPVGTGFRFAATMGHDFAAKLDGTRLHVDTDGDGKTDVTVTGTKGFLTLNGKNKAGQATRYAVRLRNENGWQFAAGGFVHGKVNGVPVKVVDQNNNGVYGEAGVDAMVVGRGKVATWFSEAIHVGGKLFQARVTADGSELRCTPFKGPVGSLHLSCTTKGKVLAAIVRSADKRYCFNAAKAAAGMQVPVGAYTLVRGTLGLAQSRVEMRTGHSKPITVATDRETKVCWGGPVRAEFAYQHVGGKVQLAPDQVWLYGAAGEEYVGWVPLGASPQFTIFDKDNGKEVARAQFPGSC